MNDLRPFRDALTDATIAAARRAVDEFEGETLYSFALYTSGESSYVFATVATEEALARSAASAARSSRSKAEPSAVLARESASLRWSPCDSPYHGDLEELFDAAQTHLDELWASVDDSPEAYQAATSAIRGVMFEALARVRDAAILPPAAVLNLLLGDQSDEERVANASRLNPPELVARFDAELARARRGFEEATGGG